MGAFISQHPSSDRQSMIQSGILTEGEKGIDGSRFGVRAAVDEFFHPCIDDGSGTHRTRLLSHVQGAFDMPAAKMPRSLPKGEHLGMGRGIL